jgi:E3 ubiquitin-protein ligase ATL6/9/15/31/42/55|uniref:RING-type E3 ubiquitin transferase n=1 Tax=Fagus sylvatica TaxID=28930 RepID=A0A2N9GBZ7_FAGSY
MNQLDLLIFVLHFFFFHVKAQYTGDGSASPGSLTVVIGILSLMFSLTILLLVYAKFCHRRGPIHSDPQNFALIRSSSRFSGIDKTVIESLPFFRFSSLKGSRDGLECAVCLSKFEDTEILRLLPKCKHAFHIECIDNWLEKHASCPLCRHKVSAEDPSIFTYTNSMRLINQSELRQDSNIELFVQREEDHHGSSRFSIGNSFRKTEKGDKEENPLIQEEADNSFDENHIVLHKHNHKIIVPDFVFKNRWSNLSSSDLMFLNSEMLGATSSYRFASFDLNNEQSSTARENEHIVKIKEEMDMKRLFENKVSTLNKTSAVSFPGIPSTSDSTSNLSQTSRYMNPTERRSMSEITALSRYEDSGMKNRIGEASLLGNNVKAERMRRLWLPIARRTVHWYANRERRSQQSQNTQQVLDV